MAKAEKPNSNIQIGQKAEEMARIWLTNKGYETICSNFRAGRAEIDIILRFNGIIVFVEVKMRTTNLFGFPETFVSERKKQLVQDAAERWLIENQWYGPIRFDILALEGNGSEVLFTHFEDAF